ncbi:hypothetical protein GCM10010276_16730 [Streptomyces longisporus]|uniref:Uncharacterized protein n=1 Tax=Streptomyces longisporus TaxID=1948 RepID=A0ABP5YIC2_STRLO
MESHAASRKAQTRPAAEARTMRCWITELPLFGVAIHMPTPYVGQLPHSQPPMPHDADLTPAPPGRGRPRAEVTRVNLSPTCPNTVHEVKPPPTPLHRTAIEQQSANRLQ